MPRLNRDIDLAIKAAMGAVAGGMMLAPDEAEAMYVGPKARGWENLRGKFSSLMDRMERAEISDAGAKVRLDKFDVSPLPGEVTRYGYDGTLGEVLQHPELFKNYPELQSTPTRMVFDTGKNNMGGSGYYDGYQLQAHGVGKRPDTPTLLHEIQHAIQEKEGWARGGSPNLADFIRTNPEAVRESVTDFLKPEFDKAIRAGDYTEAMRYTNADSIGLYRRLAGEIEARDTAARMGLSATERTSKLPFSGQGIPLRDVITKGGGGTAASVATKAEHPIFVRTRSVGNFDERYLYDLPNLKQAIDTADTASLLEAYRSGNIKRVTQRYDGVDYSSYYEDEDLRQAFLKQPEIIQKRLFDIAHNMKKKKPGEKWSISPIDKKVIDESGDAVYFAMSLAELADNPKAFLTSTTGIDVIPPTKRIGPVFKSLTPVAIGAAGAMIPFEAGAAPTKPVMTMTDIVNKWRAEGRQIPYQMEREAWREQAQARGMTRGVEEAYGPGDFLADAAAVAATGGASIPIKAAIKGGMAAGATGFGLDTATRLLFD